MKVLSIGYEKFTAGGPYSVEKSYIKVLKNLDFNVEKFEYDNFFSKYFFSKIKLSNYLNNFDIIHFHNIFDIKAALIAGICNNLSIPYVVSSHGNLNYWSMKKSTLKKKLFLYIFRSYIYNSRAIHVLNNFEKKEISSFINLKKLKLFLLPNCVDVVDFENIEKKKNRLFTILFFGRLDFKKGILELLDLINYFKIKSIKDIRFLFVGPKEKKIYGTFINKIKKLKLNDLIEIREPTKNHEEKLKVFAESDIFILPSKDEADSVSVKESLSAGLPVIISKNCKFEANANNLQFIKILDNNHAQQFIDAINFFYQNKYRMNLFSEEAKKFAKNNFSIKKIFTTLPEIYYDCVSYSQDSDSWTNE
mgnify:CR=1 FL=1